MTPASPSLTFRELLVEPTTTTPPPADVITANTIRNAAYAAVAGNNDDHGSPEAYLQTFTGTSKKNQVWLAELDGRAVAVVQTTIPLDPGAVEIHAEILVLPEYEHQGIGSEAFAIVERVARDAGRTTMIAWAEHPFAPDLPSIPAPTGFGAVPHDHIARFAQRHGFRLEQVERKSVFNLPGDADTLRALRDEAQLAAAGYEVLQWQGATPDEHLEEMAYLRSRMSTDAPSADLAMTPEVWSTDRVRENDTRNANGGWMSLYTVARHVATGQLAGFNILSHTGEAEAPTQQWDTLVRSEHRGHRLGMLVKTAGLLTWRDQHPQSPRVLTWNAEENRPMLSVNETIGFRAVGYIGVWQRELASSLPAEASAHPRWRLSGPDGFVGRHSVVATAMTAGYHRDLARTKENTWAQQRPVLPYAM